MRTITVDVDNIWFENLGYVEFTINSLVNASMSKALFELVYGTNVQTVVDQLDVIHRVEDA